MGLTMRPTQSLSKISRQLLVGVLGLSLLAGIVTAAWPQTSTEQLVRDANAQMKSRNYRDAAKLFTEALERENIEPLSIADSLSKLGECSQRLRLEDDFEETLLSVVEKHGSSPEVILAAVTSSQRYLRSWGMVIDGEFHRNPNTRAGRSANVADLDRIRSLRWLVGVLNDETTQATPSQTARIYLRMSEQLLQGRGSGMAWRLAELTDLAEKLDYTKITEHSSYQSSSAPVSEDGGPLLHSVPESLDQATTDGERLRYCLSQAAQSERLSGQAKLQWARFVESQFSVATLREFQWLGSWNQSEDNTSERLQLTSLSDSETLAELATGIERFSLPDDYHHIALYRELVDQAAGRESQRALQALANIYLNRRQYDRAIEVLKLGQEREYPFADSMLASIIDPRLRLEPLPPIVADSKAQLPITIRNAQRVELTLQPLDLERLYRELKVAAGRGQWSQVTNPNHLLRDDAITNYFVGEAVTWSEDVDCPDNHWNVLHEATLPATAGGLYFVTAEATADDKPPHRTMQFVWVQGHVLSRKVMKDGQHMYMVSDAASGKPTAATVELFGRVRKGRTTRVDNRVLRVDQRGWNAIKLPDGTRWTAVARVDGEISAIIENDHTYNAGRWRENALNETTAFCVTDRPIYRPGDTVNVKAWLASSGYAGQPAGFRAGVPASFTLYDSRGEVIETKSVKSDRYGGIDASFELPGEIGLGQHTIRVSPTRGNRGGGVVSFAVEEYRKPEFEVEVVTPTRSAALGETVKAKIKANYYFGAPVAGGQAQVKVTRMAHHRTYYPVTPFDWLYDEGYWWTGGEYDWLPGWRGWCGCFPPGPWYSPTPPDVVISQELTLNARGEATIEIDTALAKQVFGDQAQEYSIEVVVRDASRRSIVGSGKIVAAKDPFKIYSWTSKGFYQAQSEITARFQVQQFDGAPAEVNGQPIVELRKLSYAADGTSSERTVYETTVEVDDAGNAACRIPGQAAGQYRVVMLAQDDGGHEVEGGYVFVVRGQPNEATSPRDVRFANLEIIPDQRTYAPGETARLQIGSAHAGAEVWLFVRCQDGQYDAPQAVKLNGNSTEVELPILAGDLPNIIVEAMTVFDGQVHHETRMIAVPPSDQVLDVQLTTDKESYLPGETAQVQVTVLDADGQPVRGTCTIAAYDRSLEQLASSSAADIRQHFWQWKRSHYINTRSSTQNRTWPTNPRNQPPMSPLGIFGESTSTDITLQSAKLARNSGMGGGAYGGEGGMGGYGGGMGGAMAMEAMSAPQAADRAAGGPGNASQPVTVRKEFVDAALWVASIETGADGRAKTTLEMPENLTSWQFRSWALASGVRVGSGKTQAVTHKPLLVRLIMPRFFTETDTALVSAIVHNDYDQAIEATIELQIDGETQLACSESLVAKVSIPAHGEARHDWPVRAIAAGEATVRAIVRAAPTPQIEGASDAMELPISVVPYGGLRTESFAGTLAAGPQLKELRFRVPEQRHAELSELTVRVSPSLALAMVEALPYLIEYPYGCAEQTINRFLPALLTERVLRRAGTSLSQLEASRSALDPNRVDVARGGAGMFDAKRLNEMVAEGARKLTNEQLPDGSWGWFAGQDTWTNTHTSLVVLRGLLVAKEADVPLVADVTVRGLNWLNQYTAQRLAKITDEERPSAIQNSDAFALLVLSRGKQWNKELQTLLFERREKLSVYGLVMLATVAHRAGDTEQFEVLHQNVRQYLVVDRENDSALLDDLQRSWYWYSSSIEATAMYLKLLSEVDPKSADAPRLVRYLLNNRSGSGQWDNTRDTGLVIEALADFLAKTNELGSESSVVVRLDGKRLGELRFAPGEFFSSKNSLEISGRALAGGDHKLTFEKSGEGNLYYAVFATNYTREVDIPAAGLELKIQRRYYAISEDLADRTAPDKRGGVADTRQAEQLRQPLQDGDPLASGQLVEVELLIESKNEYEYVLVEDFKPAGLEPVETHSGHAWDAGLRYYREMRERYTGLCIEELPRGQYSIRYQLRAETPGTFTAAPATIAGMYAPDLRGNSANKRIAIVDNE